VMERHLNGDEPISLVFAIPDHPWTKATKDAAAVRIAMTVAERGTRNGELCEVVSEAMLETDEPVIACRTRFANVNSDLTVGVTTSTTSKLLANSGIASRGVVLHGAGFMVSQEQMSGLGYGVRDGLKQHIRRYRNGKDITQRPRGKW